MRLLLVVAVLLSLAGTATADVASALQAPKAKSSGEAKRRRARANSLPAPTKCSDVNLAPALGNLDRVRDATLCLINQERARGGLVAFAEQPQLEVAAAGHVTDMLARNFYAHVTPDGQGLADRVAATGYLAGARHWMIGENLAYATGDASPARVVAAWMASPDHRGNLLTPDYRDSGIAVGAAVPAFVADGSPGGLYAQDLGVRSP